jgi:hypothetical protein
MSSPEPQWRLRTEWKPRKLRRDLEAMSLAGSPIPEEASFANDLFEVLEEHLAVGDPDG